MDKRLVVLLRHPQTELASGKRFIGRFDVALSGEGLLTSEKLAAALQGFAFSGIYASSLRRSRQLAEIIAVRHGLQVRVEKDLDEISLGQWDGRYIEEVQQEHPLEYRQRGQDIISFRPPGGENFLDLQQRVLPAFRRIIKQENNLLIAAHTSVNRVILGEALGLPLAHILRIRQDYGCCNLLVQQGDEFEIKLINGSVADLAKE